MLFSTFAKPPYSIALKELESTLTVSLVFGKAKVDGYQTAQKTVGFAIDELRRVGKHPSLAEINEEYCRGEYPHLVPDMGSSGARKLPQHDTTSVFDTGKPAQP